VDIVPTTEELSEMIGGVQVTTALQTFSTVTVTSPGQAWNTGAVLSSTMTLNWQVLWFKLASLNVYVTSVSPMGKISPGLWFEVEVIAEQSVADGRVHDTVATPFSFAIAEIGDEGHEVMAGGAESTTDTLKMHVDEFPWASVAVYVTCVVPKGNSTPGWWLEVSVALPHDDEITGDDHDTVFLQVLSAAIVISAGQFDMTGGAPPETVTLKE
jgi:hypothetical protein